MLVCMAHGGLGVVVCATVVLVMVLVVDIGIGVGVGVSVWSWWGGCGGVRGDGGVGQWSVLFVVVGGGWCPCWWLVVVLVGDGRGGGCIRGGGGWYACSAHRSIAGHLRPPGACGRYQVAFVAIARGRLHRPPTPPL